MHHGAGAVLQPVGQLGRQVEVLAAGAERGRRQDQVPHPPLVALVQPLVDLVHAAEGDGGELLQGEHVQRRGHAALAARLVVRGQLLNENGSR